MGAGLIRYHFGNLEWMNSFQIIKSMGIMMTREEHSSFRRHFAFTEQIHNAVVVNQMYMYNHSIAINTIGRKMLSSWSVKASTRLAATHATTTGTIQARQ